MSHVRVAFNCHQSPYPLFDPDYLFKRDILYLLIVQFVEELNNLRCLLLCFLKIDLEFAEKISSLLMILTILVDFLEDCQIF
jgi:hypothetical protein